MLRGAIIGFGNIAIQGHVPAWRRRRDVEIVGAADVRPVQRAALETHLPGARWYESPEQLLGPARLSLVDISTPPTSRRPPSPRAPKRGLPVLWQKPPLHSLAGHGS